MKNKGFTLIELMVAVAVIGILSAIALPSYQENLRRGYRSDAQSVLLEATQYMERIYSECNSYVLRDASTTPPCTSAVSGLPASLAKSPREGTKRYDISLTTLAAQNYVIAATPVSADGCGTFTADSVGVKSLSGATLGVNDCWRR